MKFKWSMPFSTEFVTVLSSDSEESKSGSAIIVAGQTIYFVGSSGVLSEVKVISVGYIVSVVVVSIGDANNHQLLLSCSNGSYVGVVIAKATRQLVSQYAYTPSLPSFLPCCESMTTLASTSDLGSSSNLSVFGYHSQFGYQVLNLVVDSSNVNIEFSVASDVEWNDNCRLTNIARLHPLEGKHPLFTTRIISRLVIRFLFWVSPCSVSVLSAGPVNVIQTAQRLLV